VVVDLTADSANAPLSLEDVEELLAADARQLLRAPEAPRVLLSRLHASLRRDAEERKRLRTDVARMAEGYKMKSSPLAAAVESLGRLNPTEQGEVFTIAAVGLLESLRTQIAEARAVRQAAVHAQRRSRLVLSRLLEGGNLTPGDAAVVRSELELLDSTSVPELADPVVPAVVAPVRVAPAGSIADVPLGDLFA
jgi:hypothetical protein